MQKESNLKKLSVYFKEYKKLYIILFIALLISEAGVIFYGGLIGQATQELINKNIKTAIILLIIYGIISLINNIIYRLVNYVSNKIQIKISRKIGFDTYIKSMKLPAYAYEDMSSGEIINRINNDTETIVGKIDELMSILSYFVMAIVLLIYIFFNSWIIGLEIIIFLILFYFISKYYQKKLKYVKKQKKQILDNYTSITNESIRGFREIKTLGITNTLKNDIKNIIRKLLDKSIIETKENNKYTFISTLFRSILEIIVFITCAILIKYNKTTISFLIAMTYYIYQYTYIVQAVTDFSKGYQDLEVSLTRINEILFNKKYEDVKYGNKNLINTEGILEFKNVTFNYPNEGEILKNFNVKFEKNKKIAIVGPSGEGKTTLFNLITRIFDPTLGKITLDGIDIKELTEESLRKNISIIRQEPFLFNRTIYENFKLVDPKIEIEIIRKYCKLAFIDDYIMSLPQQYNTVLGENGINLSGGQKQRIAIARSLLKDSKIILFDEATSALDNKSQDYIKKSIDKLVKNHTVLIIAHRLSTIIDSDIIYVMKKGKIIAKGNHNELIENCDFYKSLYSSSN